jgi:hypothetical protein
VQVVGFDRRRKRQRNLETTIKQRGVGEILIQREDLVTHYESAQRADSPFYLYAFPISHGPSSHRPKLARLHSLSGHESAGRACRIYEIKLAFSCEACRRVPIAVSAERAWRHPSFLIWVDER